MSHSGCAKGFEQKPTRLLVSEIDVGEPLKLSQESSNA